MPVFDVAPDRRPVGGNGGGGGSSSSSSKLRWRESNSGPRGFIARGSLPVSVDQSRQGSPFFQVRSEDLSGRRANSAPVYGFRASGVPIPLPAAPESTDSDRGTICELPAPLTEIRLVSRELPDPVLAPMTPVAVPVSAPAVSKHDVNSGGSKDGKEVMSSVGWQSRKWLRPCSVVSKVGTAEAEDAGVEVKNGEEGPSRSPTTSPLESEGGTPRKKQRLAWGQGLAKFEKKKVEVSGDTADQNGLAQCGTSPIETTAQRGLLLCPSSPKDTPNETAAPSGLMQCDTNPTTTSGETAAASELVQCPSSPKATLGEADTSLRNISGCISPTTLPASCPKAKFEEEKSEASMDTAGQSLLLQCASHKATPDDSRPNSGCASPTALRSDISGVSPARPEEYFFIKNNDARTCVEKFSMKLDPFEASAISHLNSVLADVLQSDDVCSGDYSFTSHTSTTKLLVLKGDISKELERTECELDLLENELKTLNADVTVDPCQSSLSVQAVRSPGHCLVAADITMKMPPGAIEDANGNNLVSVSPKSDNLASSLKCNSYSGAPGAPKLTGHVIDDGEIVITSSDHKNGNCLDTGDIGRYGDNEMSPNDNTNNNPIVPFMASTRDITKKVSQVFDETLSADTLLRENRISDYISSCRGDVAHFREKLAARKRICKFTERLLALKFTAFQHLWKEDLRLLAIRKNKAKSQKQSDVGSRSTKSTSQRQRSSVRSRFALRGNLTLVPTSEIVDFTSKLLSNSLIRPYRKSLNMPSLIFDEMDVKYSKFISHNGLIEDPIDFEKERAMIHPWAQAEKEVFLEMLSTFGKDFTKISSCLANKTTADCIEFYYKNHKSEIFKDAKKRCDPLKLPQIIPSQKYLVTTSRKNWNREASAASLDMPEEVSVAAALMKVTHGRSYPERVNSAEISRPEIQTETTTVLVGNCDDLSSEAMSSCVTVTSSTNPAEKKAYATLDRSLTPQAILNFDEEEDTCSDEEIGEVKSIDWTYKEKSLLVRALGMYGMDFSRISHFVGTRSGEQCKIFFSKARKKLGLNGVLPRTGIRDTPLSDMDEGGSDADDACTPDLAFETNNLSDPYDVRGTDYQGIDADKVFRVADHQIAKDAGNSDSIKLMKGDALRRNKAIQFQNVTESVDGKSVDMIIDNMSPPVKHVIAVTTEAWQMKSCGSDLVQEDYGGGYPFGRQKTEVDSQQPMLPESGLCRQNIKEGKDTDNSVSLHSTPDSDVSGINLLASHKTVFPPNYQPRCSMELTAYSQNHEKLLKLEKSTNLPPNKMFSDSSISIDDLEQRNNRDPDMVAKSNHRPCLLANHSSNRVIQRLDSFGGNPHQLLNLKDMNREAEYIRETKVNMMTQRNQIFLPDMKSEENLPSQILRSCSQTSCIDTADQPHRTGNVRLFGQILSQSSSQHKSFSSAEDSVSRSVSPRQNNASTMKPSNSQKDVATSSGSSEQTSQAEIPLRSYGFWDGNRIQTGFASLPESAMLAKCQESRPNSIGVLTDYQRAYMQTLAANGKWPNSFHELPTRNEFDAASGFQHQGGAMLGANMTVGGANSVGAQGGVSDPVTALRLHYARRSKIAKNDLQAWRGD